MALNKIGASALATMKKIDSEKHAKVEEPKALDEETYTRDLEHIIVKDFFPDLPKMQAQAEYLDALRTNDVVKLREIQRKYSYKTGSDETPDLYNTPATFETPDKRLQTPLASGDEHASETVAGKKNLAPCQNPESNSKDLSKVSLDAYLSRNTSEDNASFKEIMKESEQKHREKHAWLFEEEKLRLQQEKDRLALPTIEQQAIEMPKSNNLDTWKYENKNHLMYVPEGVEKSAIEKIIEKKKPREIVHSNTRFEEGSQVTFTKGSLSTGPDNFLAKQGKIGVDGKEILPAQSPQVGGFGFIATPSPAPGVDASPLMTWGEIEGTPFRLDGGGTPLTLSGSTPSFKIPEVPHRDRLGMELSEKASKLHRAKKQKAMDSVTSRLHSPAARFGSRRSSERLQSLSPAAQRLASTQLGIRTSTDRVLRQSYTPSPLRSNSTPSISKTPSSTRTPKSLTPKPKAAQSPLVRHTNKPTDVTSLTDNLLNLPIKRKRASDFF